jgi:hypothetical protein
MYLPHARSATKNYDVLIMHRIFTGYLCRATAVAEIERNFCQFPSSETIDALFDFTTIILLFSIRCSEHSPIAL